MNKNIAVFTIYEDKYVLMHIVGQKAENIYIYDSLSQGDIGAVINCRTESRVDNIDSCFVKYSQKLTGFINKSIKCETVLPLMYKKEPYKDKKALFTDRITIDGKYVVVTRGKEVIRASSKADPEEKKQYINVFTEIAAGSGNDVILRTSTFTEEDGLEKAKEEYILIRDKLSEIYEKSRHVPQYTVLYRPLPGFIKDVLYLSELGIEEVVTDRPDIEKALCEKYEGISGPVTVTDRVRLRMYDDSILGLTACYALKAKISEMLSRKVYLKSGAYITIDETEALTAVDVNSAGCVFNSDDPEETFLGINREAAIETARQIRLRNISGMIIIDFINMKKSEDYDTLRECITISLAEDRTCARFVDFTGLHLAEIVRSRTGRALYQNLRRQI